jgi:hypothetical protein
MIKIIRNPNFAEWLDIKVFDKLIDNAKTQAKAMKIAEQVKSENPHFQIVTIEKKTNA